MIPKITKGTRVRGLLEYLFGPGRHEEHTNQRVVAGYADIGDLEPGTSDDGRRHVSDLTARLEAPLISAGNLGEGNTVWQCSLSVRQDERAIADGEWQRIAEKFVEQMGFTGSDDKAGCRWVAVHHGRSNKGNDHIHIVVTMATADGGRVYPFRDYSRAQQACSQLEKDHGLLQLTPGRDGATRRPELSRAELDAAALSAAD